MLASTCDCDGPNLGFRCEVLIDLVILCVESVWTDPDANMPHLRLIDQWPQLDVFSLEQSCPFGFTSADVIKLTHGVVWILFPKRVFCHFPSLQINQLQSCIILLGGHEFWVQSLSHFPWILENRVPEGLKLRRHKCGTHVPPQRKIISVISGQNQNQHCRTHNPAWSEVGQGQQSFRGWSGGLGEAGEAVGTDNLQHIYKVRSVCQTHSDAPCAPREAQLEGGGEILLNLPQPLPPRFAPAQPNLWRGVGGVSR